MSSKTKRKPKARPAKARAKMTERKTRSPRTKIYKPKKSTTSLTAQPSPRRATSVVIKHSELVAQMFATTDYAERIFQINAGSARTFPWLSNVASYFDFYKFNWVTAEFRTQVSPPGGASTGVPTGGVIFLNFDNDVYDKTYGTAAAIASTEGTCTTNPWSACTVGMSKKRGSTMRDNFYVVGDGEVHTRSDADVYQTALHVASANSTVGVYTCGDIWLHYEVELFVPSMNEEENTETESHYHGVMDSSGHDWFNAPVPGIDTLEKAIDVAAFSLGRVVFKEAGKYFVRYCIPNDAAVPTTITPPGTFFDPGVSTEAKYNFGSVTFEEIYGTHGGWMVSFAVTVLAAYTGFTWSGGLSHSSAAWDIVVSALP